MSGLAGGRRSSLPNYRPLTWGCDLELIDRTWRNTYVLISELYVTTIPASTLFLAMLDSSPLGPPPNAHHTEVCKECRLAAIPETQITCCDQRVLHWKSQKYSLVELIISSWDRTAHTNQTYVNKNRSNVFSKTQELIKWFLKQGTAWHSVVYNVVYL